jgi:hypothetical protein
MALKREAVPLNRSQEAADSSGSRAKVDIARNVSEAEDVIITARILGNHRVGSASVSEAAPFRRRYGRSRYFRRCTFELN